ncbi:hypothetical protein [Antrihabitans cavernicola]|uniref:Tyr recombinase domain-containing protein n=1 Tax=Antrihabitans cavernicola TaxID=2495913 RepID=A0A5A7SFK6_9NOCA|nr:hypothetical protein [Spelaeibacter cavernicola]KAA0024910.1 hypothetical protein FOY51_03020 [Spelaeibacter cavernicola]
MTDSIDSEDQRFERLRSMSVRTRDRVLAEAAVDAAARLRARMPISAANTDRNATALIARFLVAEGEAVGVVEERTAFRRANVDRYLTLRAQRGTERSTRECRNILYAAGRVLHPREYPAARVLPAPRFKRQPAATAHEIRDLYALIPGLPTSLGTRVQVLVDLCWGAGARPADFKSLRGTALTSTVMSGRAISVVALPNSAGGVRQVPVIDEAISARLIGLAARTGNGLVLAPSSEFAERNIVNRVSEHLRRRGYKGVDTAALRNRWILDLSERIPAALLMQLADVVDIRVLADQRDLLHRYKLRHAITVMMEANR